MLQDYQERMYEEYKELTGRMDKLTNFMHGDIFAKMEIHKQKLMQWQLSAMKSYAEALAERCLIEGFSPITGEEITSI